LSVRRTFLGGESLKLQSRHCFISGVSLCLLFIARNSLYPTTWEGDAEGKPEEEPLSRLRNFSIVNIPHLMTLNENLVNQGPGH